MKVPEGCAICESTWGNYWEEVEEQRMFFCCDICAIQFKNMIGEVKKRTGWPLIDEIRIKGDYRGRQITALKDGSSPFVFYVRFGSRGEIQRFTEEKNFKFG